jgi:hypothetical protein
MVVSRVNGDEAADGSMGLMPDEVDRSGVDPHGRAPSGRTASVWIFRLSGCRGGHGSGYGINRGIR